MILVLSFNMTANHILRSYLKSFNKPTENLSSSDHRALFIVCLQLWCFANSFCILYSVNLQGNKIIEVDDHRILKKTLRGLDEQDVYEHIALQESFGLNLAIFQCSRWKHNISREKDFAHMSTITSKYDTKTITAFLNSQVQSDSLVKL